MPTERDYLAALVMGEAANQDEVGMALVMDVLANRAFADNPSVYGRATGHAPNTFAGQALAHIPSLQFSSTDRAQSIREGGAGAYERFYSALFEPETLSGADAAAYERALELADTYVNPENPNYGAYRGIARGADFFDTGTVNAWAGRQEWGQANQFRHGGHVFRSTQPLAAEFGTAQNMGGAQAMASPRGVAGMFPTPPARPGAGVQEQSLRRTDGVLPAGALPYAAPNAFPEADLQNSRPVAATAAPTPPARPGNLPSVTRFGEGATAGMTGIGRDVQGMGVGYRDPNDPVTGTMGTRPAGPDARLGTFSGFDVVTTRAPESPPQATRTPSGNFDLSGPVAVGLRENELETYGQGFNERPSLAVANPVANPVRASSWDEPNAAPSRSRLSEIEPAAPSFGPAGPQGTATGTIGDPYSTDPSTAPTFARMDDAGDVASRARAASSARVEQALPSVTSMTYAGAPPTAGAAPSPANEARADSRNPATNPAFTSPGQMASEFAGAGPAGGSFTLGGPRGPSGLTLGTAPDQYDVAASPGMPSWASIDRLEQAPVVSARPAPLDISPPPSSPTVAPPSRSRLSSIEPPAPSPSSNPVARGVGAVVSGAREVASNVTGAARDFARSATGADMTGTPFEADWSTASQIARSGSGIVGAARAQFGGGMPSMADVVSSFTGGGQSAQDRGAPDGAPGYSQGGGDYTANRAGSSREMDTLYN